MIQGAPGQEHTFDGVERPIPEWRRSDDALLEHKKLCCGKTPKYNNNNIVRLVHVWFNELK